MLETTKAPSIGTPVPGRVGVIASHLRRRRSRLRRSYPLTAGFVRFHNPGLTSPARSTSDHRSLIFGSLRSRVLSLLRAVLRETWVTISQFGVLSRFRLWLAFRPARVGQVAAARIALKYWGFCAWARLASPLSACPRSRDGDRDVASRCFVGALSLGVSVRSRAPIPSMSPRPRWGHYRLLLVVVIAPLLLGEAGVARIDSPPGLPSRPRLLFLAAAAF